MCASLTILVVITAIIRGSTGSTKAGTILAPLRKATAVSAYCPVTASSQSPARPCTAIQGEGILGYVCVAVLKMLGRDGVNVTALSTSAVRGVIAAGPANV